MKKIFIRIQSPRGGSSAVADLMVAMYRNGIPFVMANSGEHTGSRMTMNRWVPASDLLFALVRVSDLPLINLINTQCCIIEKPDFRWWR